MSQCVLTDETAIDKTKYKTHENPQYQIYDQYEVPFFTTYRDSIYYSGTNWMSVKYADIDGERVYYINQNTLPPKPDDYKGDRYNWIFVPQLWNYYDGTNTTPASDGILTVYYLNDKLNKFEDVDIQEYNNKQFKHSVHGDGSNGQVISDSTQIPENLQKLMTPGNKLYVSFKWTISNNNENFLTEDAKTKTFYGIYDFKKTDWNYEQGDQIELDDGTIDYPFENYTFNSKETTLLTNTQICEAMTDFLNFVKNGVQPSPVAGQNLPQPPSTGSIMPPMPPVSTSNPIPVSTTTITPVSTSNPIPVSTTTITPVSTSVINLGPKPGSIPIPISIKTPVSTSVPTTTINPVPENKTFIGVIFKDMIPEEVNVVYSIPAGSTVYNIDDYIDNIVNGTVISRDDETVYFELTAEDETEMADLISKI